MYGKDSVSPRKAMASGSGGDFGVGGYPPGGAGRKINPDHTMGTGTKGAMADGERGIGASVHHSADHHPAQAAPDHGPGHQRAMGNSYGGKV